MVRATIFGLAGAAALINTGTLAADLPLLPPAYPPVVEANGWYLRGFIGMSNQFVNNISRPDFATASQFTFLDKGGFGSAPFGGGGVGYQWNEWFRVDATVEYRGSATFNALDRFFDTGRALFVTNHFTATKSELVGLINGYFDLGTWWCITPFIGAGAGVTYNKIEHFRDLNRIAIGGDFADTGTKTDFAWALYAGAAYKVTPGFVIDVTYRYLNLGKAVSGTVTNVDPTVLGTPSGPVTFNNLQSHDFMIGMRWMLAPPEPAYPPPLIRKG